jgi:hypothetical protein
MEAPTSSLLSEIFLQHLEHNYILHILTKHTILAYYKYVDDILVVYNCNNTNIITTLLEFNNLHYN